MCYGGWSYSQARRIGPLWAWVSFCSCYYCCCCDGFSLKWIHLLLHHLAVYEGLLLLWNKALKVLAVSLSASSSWPHTLPSPDQDTAQCCMLHRLPWQNRTELRSERDRIEVEYGSQMGKLWGEKGVKKQEDLIRF